LGERNVGRVVPESWGLRKEVYMASVAMETRKAFTPGKIAGLQLRNRIIRAGCFEGMCENGSCSDLLIEHHRAVAAGGTAMTTVSYCSVSEEARAYGHEMWMRKEILPDLRRLTDAVHKEGGAASVQLGHCGYFASKADTGFQPVGASRKFNLFRISFPKPMTEADINKVKEQFASAALLAREAGFDAIEIHSGHGYLLSQFLSPFTNHRTDIYGGSLENRMRFPASVVKAVREAMGPDFPIMVKMNMTDGIKGGIEIEDAVAISKRFEAEGASGLVPSCGFTSKTPFMMMRGNLPILEFAAADKSFMRKFGLVFFGRFMCQEFHYSDLFLMQDALKIVKAVKIPVVLVGGVCSVNDLETAMNAGFEFVEIGRAIIKDPDIVNKWQKGELMASDCDHCNRCVAVMNGGPVYCVCNTKGPLKRKHQPEGLPGSWRA
jgi:2,4-dienoyl-CoA reductase-like NADH-dependent reductase (Old Yellow Enzyme family)